MSRGRPRGWGRQRLSAEERAAAIRNYEVAVERFQRTAFRNLRHALANLPIFFGLVSAFMISSGELTVPTLIAMSASVVGGALGIGTYLLRSQPVAARRVLIAALAFAALGLLGVPLIGN